MILFVKIIVPHKAGPLLLVLYGAFKQRPVINTIFCVKLKWTFAIRHASASGDRYGVLRGQMMEPLGVKFGLWELKLGLWDSVEL